MLPIHGKRLIKVREIFAGPDPVYCYEFNPIGSWYKGKAAAISIFEFINRAGHFSAVAIFFL